MIINEKVKTDLLTHDFYYDLPEELIAQTPLPCRDSSRLLVVNRKTGELSHRCFHDICEYVESGDVLVINDTKVIPARIFGKKSDTGTEIEVLLLRQRQLGEWEVLMRPAKRTHVGTVIIFGNGLLSAEVTEISDDGNRFLKFSCAPSEMLPILDKIGNMPLPPYIKTRLSDNSRYQTVYAKESGSAAAPTAGLHFTDKLLDALREKGVKIAPVLLHVGLGTFRPVKTEKISEHEMHSEFFSVSKESADIINNRTGKLIAVGTTSCRVLESISNSDGHVRPYSGDTGIFIYPGYKFKAVDALITNFHLPESTLIMLVSAFSSREIVLNAYKTAVEQKYRFFSFGDACLFI